MECLKFNPGRPDEHARRLASALRRGPGLVPALGGYVALGRNAGELTALTGVAFKLAAPESFSLPADVPPTIQHALTGPTAGRFNGLDGWSGAAFAREPLLQAMINLVPEAGIGVFDEDDIEDAVESGRMALRLVASEPVGPGPTVIDFRKRPFTVDRKGALAILELEARLGETVRLGPGQYFSVLLVCTGNMCRSPMAHGLLARMLTGTRTFVYSAGTDVPVGSPASANAVTAAGELGADITGLRAQSLTPGLIAGADLILVMERYHRQRVADLDPESARKIKMLSEYLPGAAPDREIPDPVGLPLGAYRKVLSDIRVALERVAKEIEQRSK